MKLIGRTLAILVAALLVCGVTYAIGNSGIGAGFGGQRGDFGDRQFSAPAASGAAQGTTATGAVQPQRRQRPEGERGGRDGGGLFAFVEVGQSFVIIAIIVAVVAGAQSYIKRRWPKKGARLTESRR